MFKRAQLKEFFDHANERYVVFLKRQAGTPPPWTEDVWLQRYHSCNVFRDDDATSRFIMKRLLPAHSGREFSVAALARFINNETSLARVNFNRVNLDKIRLNTSAYRLNTPEGLNSRAGILGIYRAARHWKWKPCASLREASAQFEACGVSQFIAYQAAHDLKGSLLPDRPKDFQTWTYWGVGAIRGGLYLAGYDLSTWAAKFLQQKRMRGMRVASCPDPLQFRAVRELAGEEPYAWIQRVGLETLQISKQYWAYPERPWGLGEVEHMLCGYDKLRRWKEIGVPPGARRFRGGTI